MRLAAGRARRRNRRWRGAPHVLLASLEAQIASARSAVDVIKAAVGEGAMTSTAREDLAVIEHQGDGHRRELIDALRSALITPVDREDVFRVSRSIDDVLDNLRDFAREWDLYRTEPTDRFDAVLDAVDGALGALAAAVRVVPTTKVADETLAASKACNRIRYHYQEAMASLLTGELDMGVLAHRELLRRLDVVGLRLNEAVDALADAAVKRTWL